jgi:hypothetical protein
MSVIEIIPCFILAALLSATGYFIHKRDRLGADESFLWYGVLRKSLGEVPHRDFRSYDPGRYYWCAWLMKMFGTGLRGLRASVYLFNFTGLSAGLIALRISGFDWPTVTVTAVILAAWAYPLHKLFEPSMLLWAILAGVLIIQNPAPLQFLLSGALVGVIGFFGVNYGLYTGIGLFAITLLTALMSPGVETVNAVGYFTLGLFVGAIPYLLLLITTPGLLDAFLDRRVRIILARRTTNLTLPIPWPWRSVPRALYRLGPLGRRYVQFYYLLLPVFSWGMVIWAFFQTPMVIQANSATVSAAFIGSFSLHHAMSRADIPHLCQSIAPMIMGIFGLFSGYATGWIVLVALFGFGTAVTVLQFYPAVVRWRWPKAFSLMEIGGARIWMPKMQATVIDRVRRLVNEYLDPDANEMLLALPNLIALYPVLELRAPVFDIFCLVPASHDEEERMLHSIETSRVRLVVIDNSEVDGREELRFSNTHPRVWEYLLDRFVPLRLPDISSNYHILYSQ